MIGRFELPLQELDTFPPLRKLMPSSEYVYVVKVDSSIYKIGRTALDPNYRLYNLMTSLKKNPIGEINAIPALVLLISTKNSQLLEHRLIDAFSNKRFKMIEWFNLCVEDLDKIKAIAEGITND